jgi:hypothetical protein
MLLQWQTLEDTSEKPAILTTAGILDPYVDPYPPRQ